jgi:hypothetical protein
MDKTLSDLIAAHERWLTAHSPSTFTERSVVGEWWYHMQAAAALAVVRRSFKAGVR